MNANLLFEAARSAERLHPGPASVALIERERAVCARNYAPVPVVVERAEGVWIWDVEGRRYLDLMSAYSAVNHGHRHPRLVAAAQAQLQKVCVTSRAYHSATLAPFLEELCRVSGYARALPMNTGAEAVETAIKAARRWGYRVRGIAPGEAEILVAEGNFHGRTTTIVGFSSEPAYRADFGPFAPGFRTFRFGDLRSLERARSERSCAVLVEPIQGEAGVIMPPAGWLREVRDWCDAHRILLIVDEVQSGLGRTGRMFAFEHEGIRPDALVLGKALGGGIVPVSALVADAALMDLFEPGSHGSTFGGNALAAAVGLESLRVLQDEQLPARAAVLGAHLLERLRALPSRWNVQVRGLGLWAGVDLRHSGIDARAVVEQMAQHGVLSKETHDTVIRIAPPLTISRRDLDWGIDQVEAAIGDLAPARRGRSGPRPGIAPQAAAETPVPAASARRAPRLLMCPAEHFEVSYRINPWMDPAAWAAQSAWLSREAREGWNRLVQLYRELGAEVALMPAVAGLPDLVFTANAALVLDGRALLARFRNAERQPEPPQARATFEQLLRQGEIDSLHELPDGVCFEGAGDAVWDAHRRLLWLGWGQRSDLKARDAVRAVYDVPALSLRLVSPHFYHLDTCLCPLSGGEMLWHPPAFDAASRQLLRDIAGDALIEADGDNAMQFAINAVCLGRELVMGYCSEPLRARLRLAGYRVHVVPLGPFQRAGGSAWCLTLRLDLKSAPAAVEGGCVADRRVSRNMAA
jgi:ornithine aminotransferase